MKNDFDKQIKNLLDGASAADAGFNLDKKAVWDRIESKQQTKIIPFKKWISHAAAVIIGILLCLPFLFHSQKEVIKTVTVTKTIPSIQTISDTVFVVQNTTQNTINQNNTLPEVKKTISPETVAGTASQPKQENNNKTDVTQTNNSQQLIATAEVPRPKVRVLHLVDMENENAIPQTKQPENYALFNKIIIPGHADDKSETISMIVSNQFFNSKN
ncbi:hypothetical protein F0919_07690 [Taibaiella lutea]|uniref:Uncharacterized protein n=1 Tax=Taibaiella lutea TaxID=2608001 RepID=A0A5M6CMF2_9BACT|nr:hypothetical protein [Taibaiella lutea]KAA5534495.1 hypothetical protein F0919_07690 [Taibaiella lutea]